MKILVIGDEPSGSGKGANSPTIQNLNKWLDMMSAPVVSFCNSIDMEFSNFVDSYDKVIVLGNKAEERLVKSGSFCDKPYFKLPHPSPRNRQLNSDVFITDRLIKCLCYLGRPV